MASSDITVLSGTKRPDRSQQECAICYIDATDEGCKMMAHGCKTCARDAWVICEACDDRLLGYICPLCNQPYAPRVYHAIPNLDLRNIGAVNKIARADWDALGEHGQCSLVVDGLVASFHLKQLHELMRSSNVCVWRRFTPEEIASRASLKAPLESGSDEEVLGMMIISLFLNDSRCVVFEMPMPKSRVASGRYEWGHAFWEELEMHLEQEEAGEEGAEEDGTEEVEVVPLPRPDVVDATENVTNNDVHVFDPQASVPTAPNSIPVAAAAENQEEQGAEIACNQSADIVPIHEEEADDEAEEEGDEDDQNLWAISKVDLSLDEGLKYITRTVMVGFMQHPTETMVLTWIEPQDWLDLEEVVRKEGTDGIMNKVLGIVKA